MPLGEACSASGTRRSRSAISISVNTSLAVAGRADRLSIVIQKIRQLRRQKTAISLTSRSAVLSRAFSVWQPDFRILWNTSTFHLRAYQCSFSIAAAQGGRASR